MNVIFDLPFFGVILTLLAYEIGLFLQKKTRLTVMNPLLIAIVLIILLIQISPIDVEQYQVGGKMISFFLAPATIILAVPLYRNLKLLKSNVFPIIIGILVGSCVNLGFILFLSDFFHLTDTIESSLLPKSITTPIGIALSEQLGGIPEITIAAIIITGITGAIIGPFIFKILKITDPIAKGIALGTSSHAIGTVKAFEIGETEGAMSSLAISITGLMTVLITPLFLLIFK